VVSDAIAIKRLVVMRQMDNVDRVSQPGDVLGELADGVNPVDDFGSRSHRGIIVRGDEANAKRSVVTW
jgi:hypothetical protein